MDKLVVMCRKGRLHCTGFLTARSNKNVQYSLFPLIPQDLYGQLQLMISRLQICILNVYVSKYLFKVLYWLHKNLEKSLQMLNKLHKFDEVLVYISIIVNCYEHKQIQSFIAHCAWVLWLNDPHPRENSISACRCHYKCRGEKSFRMWNNQAIYCQSLAVSGVFENLKLVSFEWILNFKLLLTILCHLVNKACLRVTKFHLQETCQF